MPPLHGYKCFVATDCQVKDMIFDSTGLKGLSCEPILSIGGGGSIEIEDGNTSF